MLLSLGATVTVGLMMAADSLWAQPPGGPRGRGPGGRGGFGGGIELLFNPTVQKELELVEDQEDKLRELAEQMRNRFRSIFSDMRDRDPQERFRVMRERMEDEQKKMQAQLGEILLPHQLERFQQLQLQTQLQRGRTADVLGSDELRQKLGLTDEQVEKMRETAREAQQELQEKMAKAQQEAVEKILSVLTPEQRRQWDALVGTPANLQPRGNFGRGRRGGGEAPGRRGGRRGNDGDGSE